jgi:hypothetical protein
MPRGGSGKVHYLVAQAELLKLQKSNSLCNLPDVLAIADINDTT